MKRNPTRIIEILVWPSLELILFCFLTLSINTVNSNMLKLGLSILSGIVFWNFLARIIQETVAQFLDDAFSKNIQNIFITPISLFELTISLFFASFVKMCLSLLLLSILLIIFFPLFFSYIGYIGLIWTLFLIVFGCILSLFALSFIFLYGERMSFIGWFISTFIEIFSCVMYARDILPAPLKFISFFIPTSYIFESIRQYLSTGIFNPMDIIIPVYITFIFFLISLICLKYSYAYAKKAGILTKT